MPLKMSAFISNIISCARGYPSAPKHAFNLKFPPVMHRVLEDNFVDSFQEVFVIGDIHGCYDELIKLLEKAKASTDSTLKLFVGDLVNKGPKNHEVIALLRNSSTMLAVRGNHDEVVLREYFSAKQPEYELERKNLWIKDLPEEDIDFLNNLPFTMSSPKLNVVIVHAGLMPGLKLEFNDPAKLVTMRNIVEEEHFGGSQLAGVKHDKTGEPWASLWPGPTHVYFGHDAKRKLQIYPYATGLDTGCVYGGCLTGVFINGPRKGTFVSVDPLKTYRQVAAAKRV